MAVAAAGKQLGGSSSSNRDSINRKGSRSVLSDIFRQDVGSSLYNIYDTCEHRTSYITVLIDEFFVMLYNLARVYSQSFSQHIGSSTLKNIK
jgi:hypothetical protein